MKHHKPQQVHHVQAAATLRGVKKQVAEYQKNMEKEVSDFKKAVGAVADAALNSDPVGYSAALLAIKGLCE